MKKFIPWLGTIAFNGDSDTCRKERGKTELEIPALDLKHCFKT